MNEDKMKRHIASLKEKHQQADALIKALEAERAPEPYIYKQKAEKLRLKDEIERLGEKLGQ